MHQKNLKYIEADAIQEVAKLCTGDKLSQMG